MLLHGSVLQELPLAIPRAGTRGRTTSGSQSAGPGMSLGIGHAARAPGIATGALADAGAQIATAATRGIV